jgi:hypothetical protein
MHVGTWQSWIWEGSCCSLSYKFAPGFIAFHIALRIKLIHVQNPRQQQHWWWHSSIGYKQHDLCRPCACTSTIFPSLTSNRETKKQWNRETPTRTHTHTHTDTHILTLKQRNRKIEREKEIEREMTQTHIRVFQHTLFLSGVLATLSVGLAAVDWHKTPAHVPLWWNLNGTLTLLRHHHSMIISSSSSSSWSPFHFCLLLKNFSSFLCQWTKTMLMFS